MNRGAVQGRQRDLFEGSVQASAKPISGGVQAYARAGLEPTPVALATSEVDGELVIDAMDVIGDALFGEGLTAKAFSAALTGSEAKTVRVRLSSPGGSPFEGFAIHDVLVAHDARVIIEIHGLAASAATIVAAAGDEVVMSEGALFMIHNSSGMVAGGAEDMRDTADILSKIDARMAAVYAARTGKTKKSVAKMMDAETWMDADEAKAEGFVDKIAKFPKKKAKASSERVFAMLRQFEHAPDDLLEAFQSRRGDLLVAAMSEPRGEAPKEHDTMSFKAVAKALDLSADASESSILDAVASMKTRLSAAEAKVADLEAKHAASTEVLALAQKEAKEATEAANAAEDKALDLRVKLLSATGKVEPAKATKLREKAAKFRAAGAYQLFEDELAELEASDARHSAAQDSGLDDREPTVDGTATVHGRTRADVIEATKRAKTTVAAYCRTNPDYAALFTAKELEG